MRVHNPLFETLTQMHHVGWNVDFHRLNASSPSVAGPKDTFLEVSCSFVPECESIVVGFGARMRLPFNEHAKQLLAHLKLELAKQNTELDWDDAMTFTIFQTIECPDVFAAWCTECFVFEASEHIEAGIRLTLSCMHALTACESACRHKDQHAIRRLAPRDLGRFCLYDKDGEQDPYNA